MKRRGIRVMWGIAAFFGTWWLARGLWFAFLRASGILKRMVPYDLPEALLLVAWPPLFLAVVVMMLVILAPWQRR